MSFLGLPERAEVVFPPPAAAPPINEAAVISDALLLLGTPATVAVPVLLLTTGMLVTLLATVTTPDETDALFAAVLVLPLTNVATAAFDKLPPAAVLELLAALITAAWLAAPRSECC